MTPAAWRILASPACHLAGLLLLAGGLVAAEADEIPSRRVAPTAQPSPTATPEVRAKDLELLRQDLGQKLKLQDEAARSAVGTLDKGLRELLDKELAASSARVERLSATAQALARDLDKAEGSLGTLQAMAEALQKGQEQQVAGLATLRRDIESSGLAVAKDRADMEALRKDLDQRAKKLESLTDLLGVMRKDLESVGEEVVELKQELKRMQAGPEALSGEWWDKVSAWKYWPAVAVVASGAALGVALSR